MPSTLGIVAGSYLTRPDDLPQLQLWLDAADTTTITESSGDVSQWNDKSGNARHVSQAVGANQPKTGVDTQNGLNVITFDGSNDVLLRSTATDLLRNVTGGTVYAVRKHAASPTTERIIVLISVGTSASSRVVLAGGSVSGKAAAGGRTLDADSFSRLDSTSNVSATDYQIQTGLFDYANTDLYLYLNATLEGTNTSYQSATTTSNTASQNLVIGATAVNTVNFNGQIAEVIVYHAAHTAEQRTKVWSYLAAKWGLTL